MIAGVVFVMCIAVVVCVVVGIVMCGVADVGVE